MDYLSIDCVKWETFVPLEEHLCWLKCCIINGNEWYLCSPQFFLLCYQVSRVLIPERIILRTDTNDKITLILKWLPVLCFSCALMTSVACVFKVAHPDGRLLTATAAAKATRASTRVKAALPSTSSPLPVPRPNRKPALRRKRSSRVPSPASPTSRLWTGRWKRVRLRFPGGLICSAFEPPGHVTPWRERGNRPKRSWLRSRSWRNASRTSGGFKFRSAFRRGRTCGSRSSWKNIGSEMISCNTTELSAHTMTWLFFA